MPATRNNSCQAGAGIGSRWQSLRDYLGAVAGRQLPVLIVVFLLPWLTAACLTPRSSKTPQMRGLSATEADNLAYRQDADWPKTRPEKPEQEKKEEDTPDNLTEMAEIFFQSGDYERSVLNYSKILSQSPERHDIRYKLGLVLLLSGNLPEAKQELAEVLVHKTDLAEAHDALGLAFLQENNLSAARREFNSALAVDPRRYQTHYLLGEVLMRQKHFSQALREFTAALDSAPNSARVMSAMGWACFQQKDYDRGLQWLKKAKAINPDNPKINHRLAMVLAARQKYPEALAAFRQAGDEAQAFNNIGVHYYLDGRYAEAARCFQKALELRPVFYEEAKVNLDKALSRVQPEEVAASERPDLRSENLSLNRQ